MNVCHTMSSQNALIKSKHRVLDTMEGNGFPKLCQLCLTTDQQPRSTHQLVLSGGSISC